MSSYLTIKWGDAVPGAMKKPDGNALPADRVQLAVAGFECVRTAVQKKMPSVIFVFSERKEKRETGVRAAFNKLAKPAEVKEEPTAAATRSLAVYERVFDDVKNIPLRVLLRFFQCTRLDLTKVPNGAHPDITEPNTPLVLIVDAQGKLAQVLSQTRIDSRALAIGLVDVLKKGGLRDVETLCASTIKLMDEMENVLIAKGKLEVKMAKLKADLAECESKDLRRPKKDGQALPPSSATLYTKQAVADLQPALDAAEKAYAALKEKDAAILKQSGVDLTAWQKASPYSTNSTTVADASVVSAASMVAAPGESAPPMRIWTSISGVTLEARLTQMQQDTVVLARPDGTSVGIPISKLSPPDQLLARKYAEALRDPPSMGWPRGE